MYLPKESVLFIEYNEEYYSVDHVGPQDRHAKTWALSPKEH